MNYRISQKGTGKTALWILWNLYSSQDAEEEKQWAVRYYRAFLGDTWA